MKTLFLWNIRINYTIYKSKTYFVYYSKERNCYVIHLPKMERKMMNIEFNSISKWRNKDKKENIYVVGLK